MAITLKSIFGGSNSRSSRSSGIRGVIMCDVDTQHMLPIVLSPVTGRYVWLDDSAKTAAMEDNPDDEKNFAALRSAYMQFEEEGSLTDEMCKEIFWEIIRLFHKNFSLVKSYDKEMFNDEYPFFAECVLKLVNRYNLPPLVKADLCRHAGMFRKCLDYVGLVQSKDEILMFEEVCKLAAEGYRYPIGLNAVWDSYTVRDVELSPFVRWFYEEFLWY